jgi:hypothetical protein
MPLSETRSRNALPPTLARKEHKLLITGTGRAGTTFLVRLLTELGFDTGYTREDWRDHYHEHCHAGLERSLLDRSTPYVVKSPNLCFELPELLAAQSPLIIDHVLVPIRDLDDAARSRIRIGGADDVPGGLWLTDDPTQQRAVLAEAFHTLMYTLTAHRVPHTLLHFPRFAVDADYTYNRLRPLVGGTSRPRFDLAFHAVSDAKLIHSFSDETTAVTNTSLATLYWERKHAQAEAGRRTRRRRRMRNIAAGVAMAVLIGSALWFYG